MKSFEDVVSFHGHSCPGLALGYRVSLAALRELGEGTASRDEEIVAVVENDSCAVDAVQVMTGCTFGKGNLIFRDYGKQAYTFISRATGKALRITIDFTPPPESDEEREMWKRYARGDRSEEVLNTVHSRKARKTEEVLKADEADLLRITRVKAEPPAEARIYESIRCAVCGEKVAAPKAIVKGDTVVCIPCSERS